MDTPRLLPALGQLGTGFLSAGAAVMVTRDVTSSLCIAITATFAAQRFQIIYRMVDEVRHRQ